VTLDMRRTPDLDRVEPMRAQECARVVNRHHRNHLTAERSDVFDYVESTGQGERHRLGHVRSVPQFTMRRRPADADADTGAGTVALALSRRGGSIYAQRDSRSHSVRLARYLWK
jgi:hypothetical protein